MQNLSSISSTDYSQATMFRFAQKIALFNKKNQILILKANSNRKSNPDDFKGKWDFPGGGVNLNETLDRALQREIKEEIGNINYQLKKPLAVWDWVHYSNEYKQIVRTICVIYEAKYIDGQIILSSEHEAYAWEKVNNLLSLDFVWANPEIKLIKKIQKLYSK